MPRLLRLLLVVVVVSVIPVAASVGSSAAAAVNVPAKVASFVGLGTWVDVYDYVPGFLPDGAPPPIGVGSVDTMAALGVKTLYLQAAQDDARITGDTVDPALLGSFLRRAHQLHLRVVAWYVPKFDNLNADLRRIQAIDQFRSHGERFDAIALDIEWTGSVPDVAARNDALVTLSKQARQLVGKNRALGAIVLDPVLLEVVNLRYWPDFPWTRIKGFYDVWLPMSYWTNRDQASGFRDAARYTTENVTRVRTDLGDQHALIHVIGGIADQASAADYTSFMNPARSTNVIGWSVYDFNTTTSGTWATLRGD